MRIRVNQRETHPTRIHQIGTVSDNFMRVESLGFRNSIVDPGRQVFVRSTEIGDRIGDTAMGVQDFIVSEIDPVNGDIIMVNSRVVGKGNGNSVYQVPFYNNADNTHYSPILHGWMPTLRDIQREHIMDMRPIGVYSDVFEDNFNLPFVYTVGSLAAALTFTSQMFPFKAEYIFDSDMGNQIGLPDAKLIDDSMWPAFEKQYKKFIDLLGKTLIEFKDTCDEFSEHIRVYSSSNGFETKMIYVNKRNNNQFMLDLNASDHCRILRALEALDRKYTRSQTFGNFIYSGYPTPANSLFMSREEGNEFLWGPAMQSYPTKFPMNLQEE